MGVEIEKKFLVSRIPDNLSVYDFHMIEQAYLNVHPAIRVRREDDIYYMTYKGAHSQNEGEIGQFEYNMPLDKESYESLLAKAEGNVIKKKRYLIPLNEDAYSLDYLNDHDILKQKIKDEEVKIELDVFHGKLEGLVFAEVEFESVEDANSFKKPRWFGKRISDDKRYRNGFLTTQENLDCFKE